MTEKVLIVDDDKALLNIMSERMRNRGMEVTTTASPVEALQIVETEAFDAIILDLMMPEMGGIEAFQRIKERNPELQIIFLTGHPSVSTGVDAMKLGAVDFIPKPVDLNELTEKIKQAKVSRAILVEKQEQARLKKALIDKSR
jgi:two-component system, OmpR family, response regulator